MEISVEQQLSQSPQLVEQLLVRDELTLYLCTTIVICFTMSVAGFDYTSTTIDVTFLPGSTMVTVRVLIIDDFVMEFDEEFMVTLSTTDPNVLIKNNTANVTILDDDGR